MTCENQALLEAYHDGELDPARRAEVEAHLGACEACRTALAGLAGLSAALRSAPLPEAPADLEDFAVEAWEAWRERAAERSVLRIASWLTAAAAAVLLGGLLSLRTTGPATGPDRTGLWETAAVTPADAHAEQGGELVQVAQWMADDLSAGGRR